MTIQEAKDQIAKQNGFLDWNNYEGWSSKGEKYRSQLNRAIELYARSKWDEACEAQKQICSDLLNDWESGKRSGVHHFDIAPKPEFQP